MVLGSRVCTTTATTFTPLGKNAVVLGDTKYVFLFYLINESCWCFVGLGGKPSAAD